MNEYINEMTQIKNRGIYIPSYIVDNFAIGQYFFKRKVDVFLFNHAIIAVVKVVQLLMMITIYSLTGGQSISSDPSLQSAAPSQRNDRSIHDPSAQANMTVSLQGFGPEK